MRFFNILCVSLVFVELNEMMSTNNSVVFIKERIKKNAKLSRYSFERQGIESYDNLK
jgi:hypothetical protein